MLKIRNSTKLALLSSCCLTLLLATVGCGKKTEPAAAEAKADKPDESRVHRGTNGQVIVRFDADTQKLVGLAVAPLKSAALKPEAKAYGRVLDVSGLAALVADLISADAAAKASQAELDRMRNLAAQNNASARALQTAEAAAAHDQAQAQAARLRLLAGWGVAVAEQKDLEGFVLSLGRLQSVLVALSMPAESARAGNPIGARLRRIGDEKQLLAAELLGPAPTVEPQFGGRSYLALVRTNTPGFAVGEALEGFLEFEGKEESGVLIPRDAVVRFNGAAWVYRQVADDQFERDQISLEHPLPEGWFVSRALKPDDKVVTTGAYQLLSEELKENIEE